MVSYVLRFFSAESLTMLLKVWRSRANSTLSTLLLMVAALGALQRRDNSPKASPGTQTLMSLSSAAPGNFLKQSSLPWSTTQRQSPSSPCWITVSDDLNFFSSMALMTMSVSFSSKLANMKDCFSLFSILALTSSDLGITRGLKSSFLLYSPYTSALTAALVLMTLLSLFLAIFSANFFSSSQSIQSSLFLSVFRDLSVCCSFSVLFRSQSTQKGIRSLPLGTFRRSAVMSASKTGCTSSLRYFSNSSFLGMEIDNYDNLLPLVQLLKLWDGTSSTNFHQIKLQSSEILLLLLASSTTT